MAEHIITLADWPRADHFRHFRAFEKPHYAVTVRLDVSYLVQAREKHGTSLVRGCLYAIGRGLHNVPELRTRFRGDTVLCHDHVTMSMTVPRTRGDFGFSYIHYVEDFDTFDADTAREIEAVRSSTGFNANLAIHDDVVYMSCLPWLDFTSIDNALPNAEDCIPRVSWGKIVQRDNRHEMAMAVQVHHAVVDGAHLGAYFEEVQTALDTF